MPDGDRLALVVGCGSYDDPSLQALEATLTDVGAIEAVLKDENVCRFTSYNSIINGSKSAGEREVHRFLKSAPFDSLLLLYFTGHGIKDEQGSLYFAQKDTESELLESTAVSADFIRRQMDACPSNRKVLLLDCCFAGAFPKGAKAGRGVVDIEDQFAGEVRKGRGFFVISATGEFQFAYSAGNQLEAISDKPEPSVFTKHLVHGLSTGEADTDNNGLIKVNELFDYLQRKVGAERPGQTPKMVADVEEDFVLALVPAERGDDVVESIEVDPAEAKMGSTASHQLPDGETARIDIKPGSKSGDKVVLTGLGKPGRHGGTDGDLVLEIKVAARQPVAGANIFARTSVSAEDADLGTITVVRYAAGELSLEIPPGTLDGDTIEILGKGQTGQHGGPAGRLVVTVEVEPGLPERGKDLDFELEVTPEEAATGCRKSIETPSGDIFDFEVPAGSPDGFLFPAKLGLGYAGRYGGQAGDLIVRLKLDYPKPEDYEYLLDLSAEEAGEGAVKVISGQWGRFEYAVPKNSKDGRVVRIKGMGGASLYGQPSGDLVITYSVLAPTPEPEADSSPDAKQKLGEPSRKRKGPSAKAVTEGTQPEVETEVKSNEVAVANSPATARVAELTLLLDSEQRELWSAEADLQSGKVNSVPAGLGTLVFFPVFIYLLYLGIHKFFSLPDMPKQISDFVLLYLPLVAIVIGGILVIGAIAIVFEALRASAKRIGLRSRVAHLKTEIAKLSKK